MPQGNAQQIETILKIDVDYQEAIKDIGSYLTEIKKLDVAQKELNKEFKDGTITENEYGKAMAANKAASTQLKTEMKALSNEVKKKLEADRAEIKQININEASYNKLAATYKVMKQRINEMSAAERDQNKQYIEQSKQVYERMKTLQAETGKMQLNVGNYQAAITQLITGNSRFASSLMGVAGGATNMGQAMGFANESVMALGQTMKLLLTNPVFLAIAGIAAAGMAFDWFKNYNEGIAEASRLTTQFTGLVGGEMDAVRDSIQATADTFGKDFKETLQGADTLVAQYGITWKDAIDIINKGFAAGADINGEFLSSIQQYGPALHDAGLNAEEFVAVLQQTRSGVFGKDGLDAITKASKALRDMSSSTAESLRAVGINSDQLKQKLADGSITMMQAIQQVSEALKSVGANSQEAGAIISDVFGKKGVAAGQAQLKAIADLNLQLDSLIESEGEYGELQKQLVEVQQELNAYTSALFGMDGWDEMKKRAELFGKAMLLNVLKNIVKSINGMIDLYNYTVRIFKTIEVTVVNAAATAWNAMKTLFKLIGDAMSGLGKSLSGFGKMIEGVFTFSADKISEGWGMVTSSVKGAWQSAVITARSFGAATAQSFQDGYNAVMSSGGVSHIEIPAASDAGSSYSGAGTTPGTTSGGSGSGAKKGSGKSNKDNSAEKAAQEAEKAAKEAERLRKEQEKAAEAAARKELEIRQKLIQSRLAIIKKGTEEEMRLRLEALEQERRLEMDKIAKEVEDEEARNELLINKNKEYNMKRQEIYLEFENAERQRMEQAIANDFTKRIMAAANNELEQERIKLEQLQYLRDNARQQEGETVEAFNARKLQLDQEYLDAKESLAKKEVAIEMAKVEAIGQLTGAIGDMFETLGEKNKDALIVSKILAIAEVAIQQGVAIANAVRAAAEGSHTVWALVAQIAVGIATVTASITQAIQSINSARFARGGLVTGPGTGTSDSVNARLSNGESVMTASATALFSPLLSALNQLGGGVPIVSSGMQAQLGEDMLASAIAKGYAMAPSPVVSVKEITDVGNRVRVIEELAGA